MVSALCRLRFVGKWKDIVIYQYLFLFVLFSGILRYRVDFQGMDYQGEDDEFFDLDDY